MRFDILTLFPELCQTIMEESIIGRAQKAGYLECYSHNIRDFAQNKHNTIDDTPYGGGMGMLIQAAPIYRAYKDVVKSTESENPYVIFMSPQGKVLTQSIANELAKKDHIIILCGHYEGVDQRVLDEIVDEEISVGDFVLTGGELPAMILVDAVGRLVPGVLAAKDAFIEESHYSGLLEYPQYTKPQEVLGKEVPEVLLSGHHANIKKWQRERSLDNTMKKRPDMIKSALKKGILTEEDKYYLKKTYGGTIL